MPDTDTHSLSGVTVNWISIGQAANRLGVSVDTVRRWSDAGRLPAFRSPSNQRRYREEDIAAALTAA